MKKKTGHVVYTPLSVIFQMLEVGGSYVQKYDAGTMTYEPNRTITPFVLKPQLLISDPDGVMATGDYTSQLVNVRWILATLQPGNKQMTPLTDLRDYRVNTRDHSVSIFYNVPADTVLKVGFSADFIDKRRNEVIPVQWSLDITTEVQTSHNVSLDTGRWRSKVRLSPFKKWGKFTIPVQLKYGENNVPDSKAKYAWQWWDTEAREWRSDLDDQPWYVSGGQTKEITVDQDFIQNILLKVTAVAFGEEKTTQTFVTRLRRWYGQYEEDVEFVTGKYIFADTNMVVLEAKVTNRQGNIAELCRYFDCEIFFAVGDEDFKSVAYGEEAIIRRQDLQQGKPQAGVLVRELSAYLPLCDDDGAMLVDDNGCGLFAQFPTTSREV